MRLRRDSVVSSLRVPLLVGRSRHLPPGTPASTDMVRGGGRGRGVLGVPALGVAYSAVSLDVE